jgi:hypothetical protein
MITCERQRELVAKDNWPDCGSLVLGRFNQLIFFSFCSPTISLFRPKKEPLVTSVGLLAHVKLEEREIGNGICSYNSFCNIIFAPERCRYGLFT